MSKQKKNNKNSKNGNGKGKGKNPKPNTPSIEYGRTKHERSLVAVETAQDIPGESIVYVRPSIIVNNPLNPRDRNEYEGENADLGDLARAIAAVGIRQPIVATRIKAIHRDVFSDLDDQQFEAARRGMLLILSGHRRRAAAASVSDKPVPVVIREFPDSPKGLEEELRTLMATNTDSRDVGFLGRVRAYRTWQDLRVNVMDRSPEASIRKLSSALGYSRGGIGRVKQVCGFATDYGKPGQAIYDLYMAGLSEGTISAVSKALTGKDGISVAPKTVLHTLRRLVSEKAEITEIKDALRVLQGHPSKLTTPTPEEPAGSPGPSDPPVPAPENAIGLFRDVCGISDATKGAVNSTGKQTSYSGTAAVAMLRALVTFAATSQGKDWPAYFLSARLTLPNDGLDALMAALEPHYPKAPRGNGKGVNNGK